MTGAMPASSIPSVAKVAPQAESLAIEIAERRQTRLELEVHKPPWKPRRHYASMLNGCARQLVYAQTHWREKEPFRAEGVAAMQDGIQEERLLLAELMADGFEVIEQQVQLDDERYWVTGKIDGKIKWQARKVPFEIKRLKPFVFERITTVEDFMADAFLLKYLRQLTLYLLLHNEESGLFLLSDGLGHRKVIVVPLDYQLGEAILKDLEMANVSLRQIDAYRSTHEEAVDPSLFPARIPYDEKVCGWCPWNSVCLPPVSFGEGASLAEPELVDKLRRLQALKAPAAEFARIRKEITPAIEGKELMVAGPYVVTGKWQTRKLPAQAAREDRFWQWEVECLKSDV